MLNYPVWENALRHFSCDRRQYWSDSCDIHASSYSHVVYLKYRQSLLSHCFSTAPSQMYNLCLGVIVSPNCVIFSPPHFSYHSSQTQLPHEGFCRTIFPLFPASLKHYRPSIEGVLPMALRLPLTSTLTFSPSPPFTRVHHFLISLFTT